MVSAALTKNRSLNIKLTPTSISVGILKAFPIIGEVILLVAVTFPPMIIPVFFVIIISSSHSIYAFRISVDTITLPPQ